MTKEELSRERWKRRDRWHILKPIWTYYFLTVRPGCGCAKRFGLWHTIWCSDHAFAGLDGTPRHAKRKWYRKAEKVDD